jgi:hypothetical protein
MTPSWQFLYAAAHTLVSLLDDVGDISAAIVVTFAVIKTTIHLARQGSRRRSGKPAGSTATNTQHPPGARRRRRRSPHASAPVSARPAAPRHGVRRQDVRLPLESDAGSPRCSSWDGEPLAPITRTQAIEYLRTE